MIIRKGSSEKPVRKVRSGAPRRASVDIRETPYHMKYECQIMSNKNGTSRLNRQEDYFPNWNSHQIVLELLRPIGGRIRIFNCRNKYPLLFSFGITCYSEFSRPKWTIFMGQYLQKKNFNTCRLVWLTQTKYFGCNIFNSRSIQRCAWSWRRSSNCH